MGTASVTAPIFVDGKGSADELMMRTAETKNY
jgi:hypothetical protein